MSALAKQIEELKNKNMELETEQKTIAEIKEKEEPIRAEWRKLCNDPKYIKRDKCQKVMKYLLIALATSVLIALLGVIWAKTTPVIVIVGIGLTVLSAVIVFSNSAKIKTLNIELKDIDDRINTLLDQLDTKSNMRRLSIAKEIAANNKKIADLEKQIEIEKAEKATEERINQEYAQYAKDYVFVHVKDETSRSRNIPHWIIIDGQEYGATSLPYSKYELNPGVHNIKLCYKISDSIYQTQTVTFRVEENSRMFSYKFKSYTGIEYREFDNLYNFFKYLGLDSSK